MVITEEQWKQLREEIAIIVLRLDRMHEHMVDNLNRLEKKMDNGKVKEMMEMETKPENSIIHLQDSVECFDRLLKKSDDIITRLSFMERFFFQSTVNSLAAFIEDAPIEERKKFVEEVCKDLHKKFNV